MVADENGGVEREELRRESGRGRKARGREVEMGRPAGSLEVDALKVLLKRKDMAVVMKIRTMKERRKIWRWSLKMMNQLFRDQEDL